jgi:hypothetical protein
MVHALHFRADSRRSEWKIQDVSPVLSASFCVVCAGCAVFLQIAG